MTQEEKRIKALELTKEMQRCVDYVKTHCVIERTPGGFWGRIAVGTRWFGTTTVAALVSRDILEYSEWKESHGRKFPIAAKLAKDKP